MGVRSTQINPLGIGILEMVWHTHTHIERSQRYCQ